MIPTRMEKRSTDSPSVQALNRRRFESMFSSIIGVGSPSRKQHVSSQGQDNDSVPLRLNEETHQSSTQSSLWKWLGHRSEDTAVSEMGADEGNDQTAHAVIEEGPFDAPFGNANDEEPSLHILPDEIILNIISLLPPKASQLYTLSRVCHRFYHLSQEPSLWARVFESTKGFRLTDDAQSRAVATTICPGRWTEKGWVPNPRRDPSITHTSSWFSRLRISTHVTLPVPPEHDTPSPYSSRFSRRNKPPIPIHYPTLYRARCALQQEIRTVNPYDPPHMAILKEHGDSVYCVKAGGEWLFTGSRDRTIKLWRLATLPIDGEQTIATPRVVKTIKAAHAASVLCLDLEIHNIKADDGTGIMVTGSSDMTAKIWTIDWGKGLNDEDISIKSIVTLRGHTGGVLTIVLTKDYIVTGSKDCSSRIYDRFTHQLIHIISSHTAAINSIAVHPDPEIAQVITAAGDGNWILLDLTTGNEIRRGAGGQGLACAAWRGNELVVGCNDRRLRYFSANDATLVREYAGHRDLVRSIILDSVDGVIISGSYDRSIRFWDLKTGEQLRRLQGSDALVFCLDMLGPRLISANHDNTIGITTFGVGLPYLGLFA